MKFRLLTWKDRHDVLGGTVSENNVYVNTYARYSGKRHTELEVHEMCDCVISLSSEKGKYKVERVA